MVPTTPQVPLQGILVVALAASMLRSSTWESSGPGQPPTHGASSSPSSSLANPYWLATCVARLLVGPLDLPPE